MVFNMTIERWTSFFAQPINNYNTVAVDKRIEVLLKEILCRLPEHAEHKVIVLPPEGKAKCIELTELKTLGYFLFNHSCNLLQNSELFITSYLEENKCSLQQAGQWETYLKTVASFSRQKWGFLDTLLEKERQENIKKFLKENNKNELMNWMEKDLFCSEAYEFDLWVVDQIHRQRIFKISPTATDKIQNAVREIAWQLDLDNPSNPSFFKGLAIWLRESNVWEYKESAAERIISAWLDQSDKLDIGDHFLDTLPSQIGELTQLQSLVLHNNRLVSLPPEIGQLTQLKQLFLDGNYLESLCTQIGQLTMLEQLALPHNRLVSLPSEIGQLTQLDHLHLHNNKLESLPPQIGQLLRAKVVGITHNPYLSDLPMSLGNIPALLSLHTDGTSIAESTAAAILNQCRNMRDREAAAILPERLIKWKSLAKSKVKLSGIESFEDSQKCTLNEWLVRLERTSDFARSQSALAEIVCQMLKDVIENREFKELFLVQAEANNECCEDRAAMSLNEIYTSWRILTLPETTPLCEKLELMTRAAKTLSLRKKIAELIASETRKKGAVERESVEIYLNYETALKSKLNLLSPIKSMSYRSIGERSWIDEGALEKKVNDEFFNELYELPIFQKLLADSLRAKLEVIDSAFLEQLFNLGECPKGAETNPLVFEFKHKQGEVMQQQKMEKIKLAKAWYEARQKQ